MQSIVVFFIRCYRVVFAPLKLMLGLQGCCRYTPTCSNYAEEAICAHGLCRGAGLSVRRILRCHPWGGQGFDPVRRSAERPGKFSGLLLWIVPAALASPSVSLS